VGPKDLIDQVNLATKRFCFPKRIDHRLIDNLGHLRQRIHNEHIASSHHSKESIHLKLGLGGIRDIELWLHSHQVLFGQKEPMLQTASTAKAFSVLIEKKFIDERLGNKLLLHYWRLRHFENIIQGTTDRQTYWLKPEDYKCFISEADRAELRRLMKFNQKIVDQWMGPVQISKKTLASSMED
jgi:glutamate-ammonia-ligase adenylyltransferase